MSKIEEYTATLTTREREQFKSLIEECAKREKEIQENKPQAIETAKKLLVSQEQLRASLKEMSSSFQKLMQSLAQDAETSQKILIKNQETVRSLTSSAELCRTNTEKILEIANLAEEMKELIFSKIDNSKLHQA